jgi:surfeit locus 1 family protein
MLATLRRPKWVVATLVVVLLAAIFVRLGFWQLTRLDERQAENALGEQRLAIAPVALADLLATAGEDLSSIEYRPVIVTGAFDTEEEVLIRSQVELGQAGFHVITPLRSDQGSVLVNRGWVPLIMDAPPVDAVAPAGPVDVEGWIHLNEPRPRFGAEEPAGHNDVFNRVDIDRIASQLPYEVAPVYVVAMGDDTELPLPTDPPDFSNEGPHLGYALQWFGFALVALVGFFFLVRKKGSQST